MNVKRSVSFVGAILVLMSGMLPSQVSAVGYNEIQIGMTLSEINALNACTRKLDQHSDRAICYGQSDWIFRFYFPNTCVETFKPMLGQDWMGTFRKPEPRSSDPLTCLAIILGVYTQETHNSIRSILQEKYQLEHAFTDNDVERYKKGAIDSLYEVYQGGEVSLSIKLVCSKESSDGKTCYNYDNFSFLEYRSKAFGKILVDKTKPKKLKKGNF